MEIPNPIGRIPMNSNTYGGGNGNEEGEHMIHHEPAAAPHNNNSTHMITQNSSSPQQIIPTNGSAIIIPTTNTAAMEEDHVPYKKMVRYRECLKNHAATMGGNATDGCGEFLPSGEQGTLQAFICSVCNCHRNFHRKEIEGGERYPSSYYDRRLILQGHHRTISGGGPDSLGYPTRNHPQNYLAHPHHHQMFLPYNMGGVGSLLPSESDEQENGGSGGRVPEMGLGKKRFRTKFTQEQKEKMLNFAEKVGWKIQKQEESVIQQFCLEVGVKRRVLKVWMHNNKHNLAKKNSNPSSDSTPQNHI